jgi:hypothetical protein
LAFDFAKKTIQLDTLMQTPFYLLTLAQKQQYTDLVEEISSLKAKLNTLMIIDKDI